MGGQNGDGATTVFPLRRQSLADQVAEAILAMILRERMQPGSSLPSVGELADQFGVSRTVLREALAVLAGRGIVRRSQGKETIVSSAGPQQLEDLLRLRVRQNEIDGMHIMDLRRALEVRVAELAAQRATDEDKVRLRERWEAIIKASTEAQYHDAEIAFHRELCLVSRNPLILLVLDGITDLLDEVRRATYRGRRRLGLPFEDVENDHLRILTAVEAGSPEEAAAAMYLHLETTTRDLEAAER